MNQDIEMKKCSNGITLIALVITIIVLLILAGVTIATLTGENGILTKAKSVKLENEIQEIIEKARLDIMEVQTDNNGKITKGQFIGILKKYFLEESLPNVNKLPNDMSTATDNIIARGEYGSHIIRISDVWDGVFAYSPYIFSMEEFKLGTDAKNTNMYGWKVKAYTVKTDEFTTGVWRLFYQDSEYTYLIVDECIGSYKLDTYADDYLNNNSICKLGEKLNLTISTYFSEIDSRPNIRAIAWLTDYEIWSAYKNEDAVFAIGTPTVELFVQSYNNSGKSHTITLTKGSYGYSSNTEENWLDSDYNYGIYNKGTKYFWLASSGNNGDENMISVNYSTGRFEYGCCIDTHSLPIRPIVCIPTLVFNDKYLDSVVDE